jgi:hypothetical protein
VLIIAAIAFIRNRRRAGLGSQGIRRSYGATTSVQAEKGEAKQAQTFDFPADVTDDEDKEKTTKVKPSSSETFKKPKEDKVQVEDKYLGSNPFDDDEAVLERSKKAVEEEDDLGAESAMFNSLDKKIAELPYQPSELTNSKLPPIGYKGENPFEDSKDKKPRKSKIKERKKASSKAQRPAAPPIRNTTVFNQVVTEEVS